MLLDQTIAGRRCALWVPEGTGPFAAVAVLLQARPRSCCRRLGALSPTAVCRPSRLGDRLHPLARAHPAGRQALCRRAVCWAARPPFCTGSRGSCCPSLGRGLRWTRRRTASSATRWADCLRCGPSAVAHLFPVRLPFRLAVVPGLGGLFKGTHPEAAQAGLPLPR